MKIENPKNIVGKEVFDVNGKIIGKIDKMWNSWNQKHPGTFFGIKLNNFIRNSCFRGTQKLVPICSDVIKDVGDYITLDKTMDDLYHFWNKTVKCGPKTCPTDELLDMAVYDKSHSRIGIFYTAVDSNGPYKKYGILLDPYLCDLWKAPYDTLMPIPTKYICVVKDTITLNKTLEELKNYWKLHYKFLIKKERKK